MTLFKTIFQFVSSFYSFIFSISSEKKSLKEEKEKLALKSQVQESAFPFKKWRFRQKIKKNGTEVKGTQGWQIKSNQTFQKKYVKKNIVRLSRK